MEIIIDDNYCITTDSRMCYILSKYNGRDDKGRLQTSSPSYFDNFEGVFRGYYNRRLRTEEGINSFEDIINKQQEIFEVIKKVAEELEIEIEVG